jgi:tripartite-type tricarboxylate transporter receptor subunit TctC
MDIPLIMISKKYRTMPELLAQPRLNIGISAVGGITDYAARIMVTNPDAQYIGFKTGFPEQIAGVLGGHLDGAVVTLDSSKRFIDAGSVLRLADSSLSLGWTMYAPAKMDADRVREIHDILTVASNQDNVRKILADSNPRYVYWNLARLQEWYSSERARWTGIVARHPLK